MGRGQSSAGGAGRGYPISFQCPAWRREIIRSNRRDHQVTLTGRTRPTPKGKGHPRKSWTTREWTCSCGAHGWSNHIDLERLEARG